MITQPMSQQTEALRRMDGREFYGLFMEQGTGKTWALLADAERLYAKGAIDAVLVIAPKGVHTNWIKREAPAHLSPPFVARAWKTGAGKRYTEHLLEIFERPGKRVGLRLFAINIDALKAKKGYEMARDFLSQFKCMIVLDESQRIKSPTAGRTQSCMKLRTFAEYARIATGTPITNGPMDVFSQMEFLRSGLLATTNYRAFVAEYAQLMSPDHPMMAAMIERNPRIARAQIVEKDEGGRPIWRNLEKLRKLLEPHAYRVKKKDCMDLPDKIYKTHYFTLTAEQQRAYTLMEKEKRMEFGGELTPIQALNTGMKLQQITSGFILHHDQMELIDGGNPRMAALMDLVEDIDGKFIVWAHFRAEMDAIMNRFTKAGIKAVMYRGGMTDKQREAALDDFQEGDATAFVGQPQSGGVGLTLTAAETAIYYSNDFNLETRLQSEDRCHRRGTTKHVVYIDLAAEDTIDETIAKALQLKENVAAAIQGDYS